MNKFILKAVVLGLLSSVAMSCKESDKPAGVSESTYTELNDRVSRLDAETKVNQTMLDEQKRGLVQVVQLRQETQSASILAIDQIKTTLADLKAELTTKMNGQAVDELKVKLDDVQKKLDGNVELDAKQMADIKAAIKALQNMTAISPTDQMSRQDILAHLAHLEDLVNLRAVFDVRTLRPTFQTFTLGSDYFKFNSESRIIIDSKDAAFVKALTAPMGWIQKLRYATAFRLEVVHDEKPARGDIILSGTPDQTLLEKAETAKVAWGDQSRSAKDEALREGYSYKADTSNIILTYKNEAGAIHALQSIYQLLCSDRLPPGTPRWLPAGQAVDYPLFGYRGIMLDVGRKFMSVSDLIGFMDKMSYYKLNVLHLHLSDNVGDGKSKDANGKLIKPQAGPNGYLRLYDETMSAELKALKPKDSPSDGADRTYYTKADIKLLEAAGASYGIEILPEIDTPGHSYVITNVFPQFATSGDRSVIDTTKPEAVAFVIRTMIELGGWFSSRKFHVGGDEAYGVAGRQLNEFLEKLKDSLLAAGIGTEMTGAWNNYNGGEAGPGNNYTIFNWTQATKAQLSGKQWVDVDVKRYFVPYKENGDYNSLGVTPQITFDKIEASWTKSGLPLGGETAVWNDFGQKYSYGFETINAGIVRSLPALGLAYWNGLNVDIEGKTIPYKDLPAENIDVAREYTSGWLLDKFPKLTGRRAFDILLETASHRTFKLPSINGVPELVVSPADVKDPMGWDPLDMAAAFKKAKEEISQQVLTDKGVMHLQ